jgi:hypothetical protein
MTATENLINCPSCGTLDSGTYCSACGNQLSASAGGWLSFYDTFLKVGERKRYAATLGRILRSPTKNTLALSAEGNSRQAFKFLEISAVIYTLAALSTLISGSLMQELAMPVFLVITWSISLGLFYAMARRKSPLPRSSREFLVVNSYFMGYTLPIYSAIFLLQNASPVLGGLLLLATTVPLWIYTVRVHKAFWQLRGRTILLYLFVSSFTGGIVGTVFLVALMLLTRQDTYSSSSY